MNIATLFGLLACSAGGSSDPELANGGLASIEISPATVALRTATDALETTDFTVKATFANGHVEEDFKQVAWSLTNISAGALDDDGLFTTAATNGGRTFVVAESDGLSASADVTVIYEEVVIADGLPASAADAFAGTPTADATLAFSYPGDGVAVPRNLPRMDVHVADPAGATLYRVTFDSSTTHVEIVSDTAELEIEGDLWRVITATNAGAAVDVSVEAVDATFSGDELTASSALREGTPLSMVVNRLDATGSIYFFVTTDSGIARAGVSDADWEYWFANSVVNSDGACVGCHVVSQDGERMSYSFSGASGNDSFGLVEIVDGQPEIVMDHDGPADSGYFTTIDPTSTYVAVSFGGTIDVHDAVDGSLISTIDYDESLTMPDWSPDGLSLVAVAGQDMATDNVFHDSFIVVFPHLGEGQFGPGEILIDPVPATWFYYPAWSPDGLWVAYNRSEVGTYFSRDASLYLVSSVGGESIELATINGADGNASWPRWGPIPDDDVLWLAFSSDRDFGNYPTDFPQVWIAGIDTTQAELGLDPSFPAFRMPQQDLDKGNHAPWWSAY